mgnify:CR=1 FL=1
MLFLANLKPLTMISNKEPGSLVLLKLSKELKSQMGTVRKNFYSPGQSRAGFTLKCLVDFWFLLWKQNLV